jgi:hypothetical protein
MNNALRQDASTPNPKPNGTKTQSQKPKAAALLFN